mmetsp:Transcript_6032/g.13284  ORF Transcript_6032/g.13284 Transcript_6032/m.13284 type:complete len:273 (+) Transcript_6032:1011-1829(+)
MTSRLAAPARPTLTITGRTRADLAKFWILLGMVAENSSVCRCLRKKDMTFRTSSSKFCSPMSRSASSKHRYLQSSRLMRFLFSMSFSLPGVATAMWIPLLSASPCARISIPPMASIALKEAVPDALMCAQKWFATSYVCRASSRDGHIMSPTGPSPRVSGMRVSSSSASITMGSVKTSVLPEPVKAIPIKSRPDSNAGMPWIWIGVGFLMPLSRNAFSTGSGNRISLNDLMGGGMPSPSTRMCHLSRIAWSSSSLMFRTCAGGLHPVAIDSV